jgi:hypothetical protein
MKTYKSFITKINESVTDLEKAIVDYHEEIKKSLIAKCHDYDDVKCADIIRKYNDDINDCFSKDVSADDCADLLLKK